MPLLYGKYISVQVLTRRLICRTISTDKETRKSHDTRNLPTRNHEASREGSQGNQRIRCTLCGKYMVESGPKPLGDMRISMKDACLALGMLLEGMSIRSVERLTGLHRDTIDNLILVVGDNCQRFLEETVQSVAAKDVQLDEIWSFVGMKEKTRVAKGHSAEVGDSWTFIAIDRDTKLILAHQVGQRDDSTCRRFLKRLNRATIWPLPTINRWPRRLHAQRAVHVRHASGLRPTDKELRQPARGHAVFAGHDNRH